MTLVEALRLMKSYSDTCRPEDFDDAKIVAQFKEMDKRIETLISILSALAE